MSTTLRVYGVWETVNTLRKRNNQDNRHRCGEEICRNCDNMLVEQTHECVVKKHTKLARCEQRFLYADFETDITGMKHVPVGTVAVNDEGIATSCIGISAGADFCDWLFSKEHAHYFCVFHNLMSHDYSFIMQHLQENRVYPDVIVKGLKFLQIYVKQLDITIRDSLAFLPMPLRTMPKAFGFQAEKGMFPFLFAKVENVDHSGSTPDKKKLCQKTCKKRSTTNSVNGID